VCCVAVCVAVYVLLCLVCAHAGPAQYSLGYKSTLKTLRSGKAKMIVLASNTPPLR
jgi:ribosomal protein L30E